MPCLSVETWVLSHLHSLNSHCCLPPPQADGTVNLGSTPLCLLHTTLVSHVNQKLATCRLPFGFSDKTSLREGLHPGYTTVPQQPVSSNKRRTASGREMRCSTLHNHNCDFPRCMLTSTTQAHLNKAFIRAAGLDGSPSNLRSHRILAL